MDAGRSRAAYRGLARVYEPWERELIAPAAEQVIRVEQLLAAGEREASDTTVAQLARLSERLREMREQLGLSRTEMARRLGVNRGTIAVWDTRPVPIPRRRELLAKLDQLSAGA